MNKLFIFDSFVSKIFSNQKKNESERKEEEEANKVKFLEHLFFINCLCKIAKKPKTLTNYFFLIFLNLKFKFLF